MSPGIRWVGTLATACALSMPGPARADVSAPDPVAATLLAPFMHALLVPDFDRSAKATLPFVHRSLMNEARDDLAPDLKRFSFKKAHENASRYALPIKVVRIGTTGITTVGAAATVESGSVVDYFLETKATSGAAPAPLRVFFPAGGGPPRVAYMGSL